MKSLKSKFLSLLIGLVLLCTNLLGQSSVYDSTKIRQQINAYGFDWKNGKYSGSFILPLDTLKLKHSDSGAIAYKSDKFWKYNGINWTEASGSGGGTTTLHNAVSNGDSTTRPFELIDGSGNSLVKADTINGAGVVKVTNPGNDKIADYGAESYTFRQDDNSLTVEPENLDGSKKVIIPNTGDAIDTFALLSQLQPLIPDGATICFRDTTIAGRAAKIVYVCGGSGWSKTGDAATTPEVNFIGTTDANDLVIKTNNTQIARFSGDDAQRVAFGASIASGISSFASGGSIASGNNSTAVSNSQATGVSSFSAGSSIASGAYSIALGASLKAKSFGGTVVGYLNDSSDAANPTAIDPENRVFQIGIGTDINNRANALTVLGNGKIGIGTVSPSAKFHVIGDTRFQGNGTPGSGKVATGTDANGNWTWQTPATTDVSSLLPKSDTSNYVHKTYNITETITGNKTLTGTTALSAVTTATRAITKGYSDYWVTLSQSSTSTPTVQATIVSDIATPTFARSSAGVYTITTSSLFTSGKTIPTATADIWYDGNGNMFSLVWTSSSVMTLTTYASTDTSTPADGVLSTTPIHIVIGN